MAKKRKTLTNEDMEAVKAISDNFSLMVENIDRIRQFKLGDYLLKHTRDWEGVWELDRNSYGSPIKYEVVFVSEEGLPFMKQINAKGNAFGELISGMGYIEESAAYLGTDALPIRWELDPDYADALLLQDDYRPSELHNSRKAIWKEITEHNKAAKIPTGDMVQILAFFSGVQIGDTLWTSNISHLVVQNVRHLTKLEAQKVVGWQIPGKLKGPFITVLTIVDKKGVVKDVTVDHFHNKALYKARPRSYKELNL